MAAAAKTAASTASPQIPQSGQAVVASTQLLNTPIADETTPNNTVEPSEGKDVQRPMVSAAAAVTDTAPAAAHHQYQSAMITPVVAASTTATEPLTTSYSEVSDDAASSGGIRQSARLASKASGESAATPEVCEIMRPGAATFFYFRLLITTTASSSLDKQKPFPPCSFIASLLPVKIIRLLSCHYSVTHRMCRRKKAQRLPRLGKGRRRRQGHVGLRCGP